MKKFKTTIKRTHHEATYIVTARDEAEARNKLFAICGERNIKIMEV